MTILLFLKTISTLILKTKENTNLCVSSILFFEVFLYLKFDYKLFFSVAGRTICLPETLWPYYVYREIKYRTTLEHIFQEIEHFHYWFLHSDPDEGDKEANSKIKSIIVDFILLKILHMLLVYSSTKIKTKSRQESASCGHINRSLKTSKKQIFTKKSFFYF